MPDLFWNNWCHPDPNKFITWTWNMQAVIHEDVVIILIPPKDLFEDHLHQMTVIFSEIMLNRRNNCNQNHRLLWFQTSTMLLFAWNDEHLISIILQSMSSVLHPKIPKSRLQSVSSDRKINHVLSRYHFALMTSSFNKY